MMLFRLDIVALSHVFACGFLLVMVAAFRAAHEGMTLTYGWMLVAGIVLCLMAARSLSKKPIA